MRSSKNADSPSALSLLFPDMLAKRLESLPNIKASSDMTSDINSVYATILHKILPCSDIIIDSSDSNDNWIALVNASGRKKLTTALEKQSLDQFCEQNSIWHIDLLRLNSNTALRRLQEANKLIKAEFIDFLLLHTNQADAADKIRSISQQLTQLSYSIFEINGTGCRKIRQISQISPLYIFVADRVSGWFQNLTPEMLKLEDLLAKNHIPVKSIIHVGAHEGKETATYQRMKAESVLYIEANPATFDRLQKNIAGLKNIKAVQFAACDFNGEITLHITNEDQSTSTLKLKDHLNIYPNVVETKQVQVAARKLDTLLEELNLNPGDFNIINIDIQGAELSALRGAENLLKHIDAINTEINFKPLYEGAVQFNELENFLNQHGFERAAMICPYHPSWGDALFLKKPAISMSTLGNNGRFANQIFQYAFLRFYARQYGLTVETPEWIGQQLFGFKDNPPRRAYPVISECAQLMPGSQQIIANTKYQNADIWGYFQDASYFATDKNFFRQIFQPIKSVREKLQPAAQRLQSQGKTIIGLHLRRGDYGYADFFITPDQWNLEVLEFLWKTVKDPVLFIASDDLESTLPAYKKFNPVTAVSLQADLPDAEFYSDFYLLSQCNILLLSNSTFSFAAAMLGEKVNRVYRPVLSKNGLAETDVWNSVAILKEKEPYKFFNNQ